MTDASEKTDELQGLRQKLEMFRLVADAPDFTLLTPAQVGLLLDRSVKQLADDRTAQRGPKWSQPYGSNGSIRYPVGALRDFLTNLGQYSSTHEAKVAETTLMRFDDLLSPGERLENLTGVGVGSVSLDSLLDVLASLGPVAVQHARNSLSNGLFGLRSTKVDGVRRFPLWQASHWLDEQPLIVADDLPPSLLRSARLEATSKVYALRLDDALLAWLHRNALDSGADLQALASQSRAEAGLEPLVPTKKDPGGRL